ncbi:hypothetical protein J6590_033426 [Homalodisca vitripennis]|nr:hypothetical protein J6590_033426 [Homalodisca vitripennis]
MVKKPSLTFNVETNGLKVTSEPPPTVGQLDCLQGQDRSAVTHPSSSHARRCLIRLSRDNLCTRYTASFAKFGFLTLLSHSPTSPLPLPSCPPARPHADSLHSCTCLTFTSGLSYLSGNQSQYKLKIIYSSLSAVLSPCECQLIHPRDLSFIYVVSRRRGESSESWGNTFYIPEVKLSNSRFLDTLTFVYVNFYGT